MSANGAGFSEVLASLTPDEGGAFRGVIADSWGQGRATYGGLVVALALRAMRATLPPERSTRTLLCSFVGPVEAGAVEVRVDLLRAGKAATQLMASVVQGGLARAIVQGVFGADRDSRIVVPAAVRGDLPGRDSLVALPRTPMAPRFTAHFDYRMTRESVPFQGAAGPAMSGWCRLAERGAEGMDELIVALVDAWPAPVLPMLRGPVPASSLTWALDFVPHRPSAAAEPWWWYEAQVDAAEAGYAQAAARLWTEDGQLAATSRQLVAIFD